MKPILDLYAAWNVADYLRETRRFAKAIEFYEDCFIFLRMCITNGFERIIQRRPREVERQLYMGLAIAYAHTGNPKKAKELAEKCLEINKKSGIERREANCYEFIGKMHFYLGQCEESLTFYKKALDLRKRIKDKEKLANSCSSISSVYFHLCQYNAAIKYAQEALEISIEIKGREVEGVAYAGLSNVYFTLGEFGKAIEYLMKDLEVCKEFHDREGEATTYTNLGATYHALHRNEKAIEYCEKGLGIFRDEGIRRGEGWCYLNLFTYYLHLGDYATALTYNDGALNIMRSLGYKAEEGEILYSQAKVCFTFMQYERSIEFSKKALTIKTAMGDKRGIYRCYVVIGQSYSNLGQYQKAIHFAKRSLKTSETLENFIETGDPWSIIGSALFYQGLYEESIEYFTKVLQICRAIGDYFGEGNSYANIASAYFALWQVEKSIEYHKKALQIMKEVGSRDGERVVNQSLSASFAAKNNHPEAVYCLSENIRCHEEMRAHLADEHKLSLDDQNIISYKILCLLQIKRGNQNEALCIAEQGRARGLVDLLSAKYGVEEVSGSRALNLNAMKELVTMQQSDMLYLATQLGPLSIWFLKKDGRITFFGSSKTDSHGDDLADKLEELTRSILHLLDNVDCEDRSLAAWYGNEFPPAARQSEVSGPTNKTEKCKHGNLESKLQLLFEMTISPFANVIEGPEIIIVPEGLLFLIPFPALLDSSGNCLSQAYRIRLVPSLTTLKVIHDSPENFHSQAGALIVGDPKVGRININGNVKVLCPLPKAREEAEMISEMLQIPCLVGEEATKDEFFRRIRDVSLVHIAAHGDAERGEIALAPKKSLRGIPKGEDCILTMKEVAGARIRANLVVLSCCHSARGKILAAEGVVGIARAFLGSSARSVLMSLWAVDDEATMVFMSVFYRCMIHEKMSAREALHRSISVMRESSEYNNMMYWAPFVLLGDDVKLNLSGESS
ncbi:tetratricopeptide repeat protein 28-like [Stylophora pistillata]|uniref:tetratricopeptide repeat protein 28-like n=1 Tax=Stylophora pistillata TaxID=50429 RepID=UPI000C050FD0|nr:tetratricopeptide repeat protein 28-like [Stylophora pistillata]